ncbi:hypothetical protein [Arthrobacter oryzae]|uniref:hypothetical protein n=1 Tax=Arthrobacter oryzae TaxID=409290 RepID=UPI0027821F01|nr:hypothetical protein [Arthrobacter oryzae]MDQ0076794.1 hypothetical protein [Arthrobacter oryzae]
MNTFTKRGSYPHPVLDASDDVGSSIEVVNVTIAPSVDDVEIKFQVRMSDPDIQSLMDDGTARYSFRWTCSSTIASGELSASVHQQHVDGSTYIGWIDQQDIRGTVKVEIRIIATSQVDPYSLQNQHGDYAGASFSILPGDVLADGGFFEFEPEKRYDPLSPPVGSCFRFIADPKLKKGLKVKFFDDEHVLVAFPEKTLPGFGLLQGRPDLQISLVVLPALMQTISFIKENLAAESEGEDLSGKKWYTAVNRLVQESGSYEDNSFELAQKILGHPLDASLMKPFDGLGDE